MSKRGRKRRKGKRLEAAKADRKEALRMWRKLSDTEHKHGYNGVGLDIGFFYAPYMPIYRDGGYGVIITDTTA